MEKMKMERKLLPLTSDLVFKAAYGRDTPECKRALIAVLNLILDRREDPITDLIYKNPFNYAEYEGDKTTIMDIKAVTQTGEWIDIEMQIEKLKFFPDRSIVYSAKLLCEQLASGVSYDKMKKIIIIGIVQGSMFPESEDFQSTCHFRFDNRDANLSELCELRFIELDKLDTKKPASEMTPLERFGAYLRYAADEEKAEYVKSILEQGDEVIAMSDSILRSISQDERLRQLQEARELGRFFYNMEMDDARKTAREEGWAEGENLGKAVGKAVGEALGRAKGRAEGKAEAFDQVNELFRRLIGDGRTDDMVRSTQDAEYQKELLKEYGL